VAVKFCAGNPCRPERKMDKYKSKKIAGERRTWRTATRMFGTAAVVPEEAEV
jgi:hypothetical protein